jgi:hypothetical protein
MTPREVSGHRENYICPLVSDFVLSNARSYPNVVSTEASFESVANATPPSFISPNSTLLLYRSSSTSMIAREKMMKPPRIGARKVIGFQPLLPSV